MKLLKLTLQNFKGIRDFTLDLDGRSASVYGRNGLGKTTLKDAYFWLLYSTAAREKLLFATDTYYIPNRFCGLNVIMVECNYSPELLRENIAKGLVPESQRPRLLQSHFGLQNVKDFLRANDLSQTRRIYLIHVSGRNGDKQLFEKEIRQLTGIPVTVF